MENRCVSSRDVMDILLSGSQSDRGRRTESFCPRRTSRCGSASVGVQETLRSGRMSTEWEAERKRKEAHTHTHRKNLDRETLHSRPPPEPPTACAPPSDTRNGEDEDEIKSKNGRTDSASRPAGMIEANMQGCTYTTGDSRT